MYVFMHVRVCLLLKLCPVHNVVIPWWSLELLDRNVYHQETICHSKVKSRNLSDLVSFGCLKSCYEVYADLDLSLMSVCAFPIHSD